MFFFVSSCSCLRTIHWSQVLSGEWRCSWSSADRRYSNFIWVINSSIAYWGAAYIRSLTVLHITWLLHTHNDFSWEALLHYWWSCQSAWLLIPGFDVCFVNNVPEQCIQNHTEDWSSEINPLHAELFGDNIFASIIFSQLSDGCWWLKFFLMEDKKTFILQSIARLMMTWRHQEPGHQQPCYWPISQKTIPPEHH